MNVSVRLLLRLVCLLVRIFKWFMWSTPIRVVSYFKTLEVDKALFLFSIQLCTSMKVQAIGLTTIRENVQASWIEDA